MALTETAVLTFETNLDKVARQATAAASAQKKFTSSAKGSISALEIHNIRIRNGKDAQRAYAKAQREAIEGQLKQQELLIANAQKFGAYTLAVAAALKAVDSLSQRALQLSDVHRNLPFSIDGAVRATGGLVDKYTLLQKAVQANTLGAAKTSKEYERLVRVATALARAQGQDVTSGVEDFTLALSRGSPKILDNLGLTLKHAEAQKIYADHLGISTKRLTDEQKIEAFRFAALEKGEQVIKNLDLAEKGWALRIQQTKVALMDAADNLLVLADRAEAYVRRIDEAAGVVEKLDDAIPGFSTVVGASLSSGLVTLADGVNMLADATESPMAEVRARANDLTNVLVDLNTRASEGARVAGEEYMDLALAITAAANLDATVQRNFERTRRRRGRGARRQPRTIDFAREQDASLGELRKQTAASQDLGQAEINARARFEDARARGEANNDLLVQQAERQREVKLEQLEIDRELGLTPAAQAQREADIMTAHHEHMLELQRQHVADKRAVDQAALAARLAQIRAEKAAEREKVQSIRQGFAVYKAVQDNAMSLAVDVAAATGASAERQARIANRFRGVQVIGGAIQETFEAIAAAARYDYGAAALHGAAAAFGYARGPLLLSGALDPSGGNGVGGGGGGSRGVGQSPIAGGGGGSTGGSRPSGPVSRPRTATNTPPQGGQGAPSRQSGGRTVNVNIGTVETLATNEEELGLKIRKVVAQSEATHGDTA